MHFNILNGKQNLYNNNYFRNIFKLKEPFCNSNVRECDGNYSATI